MIQMLGGLIDTKLAAAGVVAFLLGGGVAAVAPAGLGPGPALEAGCAGLDAGGDQLDVEPTERSVETRGDQAARSLSWQVSDVDADHGVASLCVDVGSIEVSPSSGDEVRLQVVMIAHGDDAAERVRGMEVEAALVDTGSGLAIAVGQVGEGPDVERPEQIRQGVRLALEVPRSMPWSIQTEADVGEIEIDDLTLDRLAADLGTGELDVTGITQQGDIDATVTTGEIDLQLTPTAHARYTLDVGTGEIDVEVPRDGSVGYEVSGETGAGDVDLEIGPTEEQRSDGDDRGPSERAYARTAGFADREVQVRMGLTASVGDLDVTAG